MGGLPFLLFSQNSTSKKVEPRFELPAAQILEEFVRIEKARPLARDVDLLRYKPYSWETGVMPNSVRSWWMLEVSKETQSLIENYPDL